MIRAFSRMSVYLVVVSVALGSCRRGDPQDQERIAAALAQQEQRITALEERLRDLDALRGEIGNVRRLATARASESPVFPIHFRFNGSEQFDPYLGRKDAPVLVMAFFDFQCAPCRAFTAESLPPLKQEFIDSGRVKYLLRDFPLSSHAQALSAARAAHCAGEQGAYWPYHDLLFGSPEVVDKGAFDELAAKLEKLDKLRWSNCFRSKKYDKGFEDDTADAFRLGVKGIPGFIVGIPGKDGVFDGVFIRGAQPYDFLRAEILKQLARTALPPDNPSRASSETLDLLKK